MNTSETTFIRFNGTEFYKKYAPSSFLSTSKGKKFILKVLSSSVHMKHELKSTSFIKLKGIKIVDNEDLIVMKGSDEQIVGEFDFTLKRLQGFCAAYACAHPDRFDQNTIVAFAACLGYDLTEGCLEDFRKFYFSFAPGTEYFSCILEFWPLVATLVHMTLKKGVIKVKNAIRKFRVKGDDKNKLMYQLRDKGVLLRIVPVVQFKVHGNAVSFSDCLKAFHLHS